VREKREGESSLLFAQDQSRLNTFLFLWPGGFNGENAMTKATYFAGSCPTCGRMLEIRVELIGKEVCCQHCNAHFVATLHPNAHVTDRQIDLLLDRADQYLLNHHWQNDFSDQPQNGF